MPWAYSMMGLDLAKWWAHNRKVNSQWTFSGTRLDEGIVVGWHYLGGRHQGMGLSSLACLSFPSVHSPPLELVKR